jgi:hypothetical protein
MGRFAGLPVAAAKHADHEERDAVAHLRLDQLSFCVEACDGHRGVATDPAVETPVVVGGERRHGGDVFVSGA